MKLMLLNTYQGLKPYYDIDFDKKRKLKIGEVYNAEIRLVRNLAFHKKYFAFVKCAWEYQNEDVISRFVTMDNFRKSIEVAAGYFDLVYSLSRQEWVEIPKSISFGQMDEAEFAELYNRVLDVTFFTFLKNISSEEFNINLANF